MTEFKNGDRVRVEIEGRISVGGPTSDGKYRVGAGDLGFAWVPPECITKLSEPLPTKLGSVIESKGHRFMLTAGGWHGHQDTKAVWTKDEFQASWYAEEFTVLLEGE